MMKPTLALVVLHVLLVLLAGGSGADTLVFGGNDWDENNQFRTFIGGEAGTTGWTTFDDARFNNNGRQQWTWMNVASAISRIPSDATVASATLSYPSVAARDLTNTVDPALMADVVFSIFEVPGDGVDKGRAAVIAAGGAGRDGMDVVDFYSENTPYGSATGITDTPSMQELDLTDLVQGWVDGSLTENVGQMMLLWDRYNGTSPQQNWLRWVPGSDNMLGDAADRPTLTIDVPGSTLRPLGDVTGDFLVNSADFDVLMQNMFTDVDLNSQLPPVEQGDLNGDGKIDQLDYRIYKDDPALNFSGAAAVNSFAIESIPEPQAALTFLIGLLLPVALHLRARTKA